MPGVSDGKLADVIGMVEIHHPVGPDPLADDIAIGAVQMLVIAQQIGPHLGHFAEAEPTLGTRRMNGSHGITECRGNHWE